MSRAKKVRNSGYNPWTTRFVSAAIIQGAAIVGLTIFLVLGQIYLIKPELPRAIAGGGAGTCFPFENSMEELQRAKMIAYEVGLPAKAKIGIMVETPASVMIIEDFYKEGIALASVGTNDLTQLTLGIDRSNERLAKLSSTSRPAILRSIKEVIDVCNRYGVETSICGEAGSDPEMAKILVKYGIESISCNIDAIDAIRIAVYQNEQELSE